MAYDPLYIRFLYHFLIDRDYFECHEAMEELWLEEGRNPLYQGLLQVAVGLYHHRNGNRSGAEKLLAAALDKLAGYPDRTLGIDLDRLRFDAAHYLQRLRGFEKAPFLCHDLDIAILDPGLQEQLSLYQQTMQDAEKEGSELDD